MSCCGWTLLAPPRQFALPRRCRRCNVCRISVWRKIPPDQWNEIKCKKKLLQNQLVSIVEYDWLMFNITLGCLMGMACNANFYHKMKLPYLKEKDCCRGGEERNSNIAVKTQWSHNWGEEFRYNDSTLITRIRTFNASVKEQITQHCQVLTGFLIIWTTLFINLIRMQCRFVWSLLLIILSALHSGQTWWQWH